MYGPMSGESLPRIIKAAKHYVVIIGHVYVIFYFIIVS
jgi:hypothetical protein